MINNMQHQYCYETLEMIYQMVHQERKTIEQIAKYLGANTERIQDIYNQAASKKSTKQYATKPAYTHIA